MSYDICLKDPETGEVIEFEERHNMIGGTYEIGGTTAAHLNVTYNYEKFFRGFGSEGIRTIYGKTGNESIPFLACMISSLGTNRSNDYWEATEGNARAALENLLRLALMAPHGVWDGD